MTSIRKAAEEAVKESKPITDMRASREYRLGLVKELTYRAITLSISKNITLGVSHEEISNQNQSQRRVA